MAGTATQRRERRPGAGRPSTAARLKGADLSFQDEPDSPPRRSSPRGRPSGRGVDAQTLRRRQVTAFIGGIVFLILCAVLLRECAGAREERGLKDYVRDARAIVDQSDGQSKEMFNTLSQPGRGASDVDRENSLKGLRAQADQLVERTRDLDRPDDLETSHGYLVESLEFRRDGIGKIVDILPTALSGRERSQGAQRLADQMGFFLTSDVIFAARVRPSLDTVLREQEVINEVQLPESRFLADRAWLMPDQVSKLLRGGGGSKAGGDRAAGDAAPGLHGTGLGTVSLGGQALTEGGSATVRLGREVSFSVQVINQGENDETDVPVKITIGKGADAIEVEDNLDEIAKGQTETLTIPLNDEPPTGQSVPITIEVEAVPGEDKTDNNKQSYSAIFTR
ncbi:MAG: DUF11 domain-containing protein [Actinomycetota bacterium]|nr:DUF11 domain-containing protein [Actinomycetota bacterium]